MTRSAGQDAVEARFRHHPPQTDKDVLAHEEARAIVRDAAHRLYDLLPEGADRERVMDDLDDALMHANAALARARA